MVEFSELLYQNSAAVTTVTIGVNKSNIGQKYEDELNSQRYIDVMHDAFKCNPEGKTSLRASPVPPQTCRCTL